MLKGSLLVTYPGDGKFVYKIRQTNSGSSGGGNLNNLPMVDNP